MGSKTMTGDRYTEGVCGDGAVILDNGKPIPIRAIIEGLYERDALRFGLNSLVNCKSALTRSQMREAAADIMRQASRRPWSTDDYSPLVEANASLRAALERIAACECTNTAGRCRPPTTCATCMARTALTHEWRTER